MQRRHAEALAGVGSGAVAFALYVWTLAPGLIDIRDIRRSSTWAGSWASPISRGTRSTCSSPGRLVLPIGSLRRMNLRGVRCGHRPKASGRVRSWPSPLRPSRAGRSSAARAQPCGGSGSAPGWRQAWSPRTTRTWCSRRVLVGRPGVSAASRERPGGPGGTDRPDSTCGAVGHRRHSRPHRGKHIRRRARGCADHARNRGGCLGPGWRLARSARGCGPERADGPARAPAVVRGARPAHVRRIAPGDAVRRHPSRRLRNCFALIPFGRPAHARRERRRPRRPPRGRFHAGGTCIRVGPQGDRRERGGVRLGRDSGNRVGDDRAGQGAGRGHRPMGKPGGLQRAGGSSARLKPPGCLTISMTARSC